MWKEREKPPPKPLHSGYICLIIIFFFNPSIKALMGSGHGAPRLPPARSPLWSIAMPAPTQPVGPRRGAACRAGGWRGAHARRAHADPAAWPHGPHGWQNPAPSTRAALPAEARLHAMERPRARCMLMSGAGRAAPINCSKYLLTYQMGSRGAKLEGRVLQRGGGTELPAPAGLRAAGTAQLQKGR